MNIMGMHLLFIYFHTKRITHTAIQFIENRIAFKYTVRSHESESDNDKETRREKQKQSSNSLEYNVHPPAKYFFFFKKSFIYFDTRSSVVFVRDFGSCITCTSTILCDLTCV